MGAFWDGGAAVGGDRAGIVRSKFGCEHGQKVIHLPYKHKPGSLFHVSCRAIFENFMNRIGSLNYML